MPAIGPFRRSSSFVVGATLSALFGIGIVFVGYFLLVARDDPEAARWLASTFGWLVIVILLLISALSFSVAYYVVSRFNRISSTMDNIVSTGNLSQRLPVDSSWDDMSKLSASLNRVLDELEKMVGGIKSVSDNIAHDLKTPLARLRGEIETSEMSAAVRERLLHEVDDMLVIFKALLRISEIDSVSRRQAFTVTRLDTILEDVIDLYGPLAEDRALALDADLQEASLYCDRDLMFQAIANVTDNAIKFTPPGGRVHIAVSATGGRVTLEVTDSGCGIPDTEAANVTRRFYRLEQSRTSPGHGLGLALVEAVVSLHRGSLRFERAQPAGTRCIMSFPAGLDGVADGLSGPASA